jgi:hypothetical protein
VKQPIAITDLTRMREPNVCIAGCAKGWNCFRPVVPFRGIPEWFLRKDDRLIICPFAVIEFDFLRAAPEALHTEDWEIDRFHRRLVNAQRSDEKKLRLLERTASDSIAEIFGAEIHDDLGFYVRAGAGEHSLGTIRPAGITNLLYEPTVGGKWDYRIVFVDQAAQTYRLAVTDLAYRHYMDYGRVQVHCPLEELIPRLTHTLNQRTTFLRIGLARLWDKFPDRCYLQVTGIYTFPDYLGGRSFADSVEPHRGLAPK